MPQTCWHDFQYGAYKGHILDNEIEILFDLKIPAGKRFFSVEEIPALTSQAICTSDENKGESGVSKAMMTDRITREHANQLREAILAGKVTTLDPTTYSPYPDSHRLIGAMIYSLVTQAQLIQFAATLGIKAVPNNDDGNAASDLEELQENDIWGEHSTNMLRKLAEASRRFWSLYDPEDPSTAPTNELVQGWLKQQGMTANIAKAMATILRADGLRTGRR